METMIDWCKLWVRLPIPISRIINNPNIQFKGNYDLETWEIHSYPLIGQWGEWEFEVKSPTWLEITGSLHKFWNDGTNGNDFPLADLLFAIINLSNAIQVNPFLLTVHNLEFGANICLGLDATRVLQNVLCFKNKESIRGINAGMYFLEFEMEDYFLKLYDKGLQARQKWGKQIGQVLRVELKARNSGFIADAGIKTLADLLNPMCLSTLGRKICKIAGEVIFDDDTIDYRLLKPVDQKIYLLQRNPKEWVKSAGRKNSTIKARENRFRSIVGQHGKLRLSQTIVNALERKWVELTEYDENHISAVNDYIAHCNFCRNSYLIYTPEINNLRQNTGPRLEIDRSQCSIGKVSNEVTLVQGTQKLIG